jgi:hypothetical protein
MNKPNRKKTSQKVRSSSPACSTNKHTILYGKNSCYVMEQGIGKELCSYGDQVTHLQFKTLHLWRPTNNPFAKKLCSYGDQATHLQRNFVAMEIKQLICN